MLILNTVLTVINYYSQNSVQECSKEKVEYNYDDDDDDDNIIVITVK